MEGSFKVVERNSSIDPNICEPFESVYSVQTLYTGEVPYVDYTYFEIFINEYISYQSGNVYNWLKIYIHRNVNI